MKLVTGATGKVGSEVARQLLAAGEEIRVLVRDPVRLAPELAAVDVAVGDLADCAAVDKALIGVNNAVLIVANGEQQLELEKHFVERASHAGIRHLSYLSSMESIPGTDNTIPAMHVAAEEFIRASECRWTMIRPTFFMQNLLGSARTIEQSDVIRLPMGNGKVAATDLRDVAGVITAVMRNDDEHHSLSYDLTGPDLVSMNDVAAAFSEVLEREIRYEAESLADFGNRLAQFLPAWRVAAVCEEFAALTNSTSAHTTDNVEKLLGRPATGIETFVRDHLHVFRP